MKEDNVHKFEKMYMDESNAIFRFCLIRVSDREKALDIMQETFLRLWRTLTEGKEIRNDRAFLFSVAHRLVIDWYRKKKSLSLDRMLSNKEGDLEYDLPDDKTTKDIIVGAEGRYLLDKIEELPPSYRDPIYLRFVEDLSLKEIGNILGISTNAASVRVNRGILELKKKTGFEDIEGDK